MPIIKWQLDPGHSMIQFKVKHMMVSNIVGEFQKFEGSLETKDYDFTTAKARFSADVSSLSTKLQSRDDMLKGESFFDVLHYPKIIFESTQITNKGNDEYEMAGNLTIRGTTNLVTLRVDGGSLMKDNLSGVERAGFEITGKINRFDFGLKYNATLETGAVIAGKDVNLDLNVEVFHKS